MNCKLKTTQNKKTDYNPILQIDKMCGCVLLIVSKCVALSIQ